jgi:hypothetical protein
MNAKWKLQATLQYALVGLGVAAGVGAFELLLAAAFGAAGLLLGSLVLAVVIVVVLRRRRPAERQAEGRIAVHDELSLNPLPLWVRTWHTPANLAGGTVAGVMLIFVAAVLLIAGWPVWAVVAMDTAILVVSGIATLYADGPALHAAPRRKAFSRFASVGVGCPAAGARAHSRSPERGLLGVSQR